MPVDLDAVRAAHPVEAVLAAAGVALRRSGRRQVGCCPFHADRRPSLSVTPEDGRFHCFGCGAGGDVFDLLGRLWGTDFRGVLSRLGVDLAARRPRTAGDRPTGTMPPPREGRSVDVRSAWTAGAPPRSGAAGAVVREEAGDTLLHRIGGTTVDTATVAVVEAAVSYYASRLPASPVARAYLAERGVPWAIARQERLGYAAGRGLAHYLGQHGIDPCRAEAVGLLAGDREPLAGRLILPDLAGGRAGWLTGRVIPTAGGRGPRYLSVRLPIPLIGAAGVGDGGAVVVVEGPLDRLVLRGWGVPVVALGGSHASHAALTWLNGRARVYLALDADPAGRRADATLRAALGDRAVSVTLPAGVTDPADLGSRPDGRAVFLASLRAAGGDWPAPPATTVPADIDRRIA